MEGNHLPTFAELGVPLMLVVLCSFTSPRGR